MTKLADVRVVVLGRDPYHQPGVATGLAFSFPERFPVGVRRPPSLGAIYNAIRANYHTPPKRSGDLRPWARGGILLLNTVLTVRAGDAGSHRDLGWECFTTRAIQLVAERAQPAVFMLWGKHARRKRPLIENASVSTSCILESSHPSSCLLYTSPSPRDRS